MAVRIKANLSIPKGVANGATGTVFHIDWQPATTFQLQPDGIWTPSTSPLNIFILLDKCPTDARFPHLHPLWPNNVMPIHEITSTFKLNGKSITIKGFPLVPAFGTTVHGVQGETRECIAISQLRPPHVKHVDRHAFYVALSRITTRKGLQWIGPPPTDEDFNYFKPNNDILQENERLQQLAAKTTQNYHTIL
jgi:hypothetical protein